MGASQAVELLQSNAKRFAGAAVLGGGGRIRKADPLKNIPVFVGVGSKDFALGGAKSLHRALEEAGAKSTFKEYPDIEHMIIVRVALPDVFAMFDKLNRPVH
jgi:predicted esterase